MQIHLNGDDLIAETLLGEAADLQVAFGQGGVLCREAVFVCRAVTLWQPLIRHTVAAAHWYTVAACGCRDTTAQRPFLSGLQGKVRTFPKAIKCLTSPFEALSINLYGNKNIKKWISIYYKIEIQSLSMGLSIFLHGRDAPWHISTMQKNHFLGFSSSKIMLRRFSIGTRTCVIVSRSRTVTVLSVKVSLSTVTHNGVPMASCLL